jgi:hypothetical protein
MISLKMILLVSDFVGIIPNLDARPILIERFCSIFFTSDYLVAQNLQP